MEGRTCTDCDEFKAWEEFGSNPTGKNGKKSICKVCFAKREQDKRNGVRRPRRPPRHLVPDPLPSQARCTGPCGLMLPITHFHAKPKGRWGRHSHCKTCDFQLKIVIRRLKKQHPKPDANGICYHCQLPTERLCLDHCHETDQFRGWACYACNVGPLARRAESKARDYIP